MHSTIGHRVATSAREAKRVGAEQRPGARRLGPGMDISVVIAARPNVPAEAELRTAGLADRLGFGDLWVGEGFVWDAFALATAAGRETRRIPLTVGPIPVSVRDPASIARAAASTEALVGRPVGVALGSSSVRVVERMHGRSRRKAVSTMAESAQALRALYGGADFAGELVSTHDYRLPLPAPGGGITLAAFGDKAIAAAARYADRMVLDLVSPELAREYRTRLDAAAAEAGRTAPRLAAWIPAAADPDPEAYEQVMWSLVNYLPVAGYAEMFADAGFTEAVALSAKGADPDTLYAALPEDAPTRLGLVGDADTVASRLRAYADAGLDETVLVPATSGVEHTLSTIASLV